MERRKHTAEFRAKILAEIADGETLPAIAKKYNLSQGMIYNWRNKAMGKKKPATKTPKTKTKLAKKGMKLKTEVHPGVRLAVTILYQYMDAVHKSVRAGKKFTGRDARIQMALDALEGEE